MKSKRAAKEAAASEKPTIDRIAEEQSDKKRKRSDDEANVNGDVKRSKKESIGQKDKKAKKDKKDKKDKKYKKDKKDKSETRKEKKDKRKNLQDLPEGMSLDEPVESETQQENKIADTKGIEKGRLAGMETEMETKNSEKEEEKKIKEDKEDKEDKKEKKEKKKEKKDKKASKREQEETKPAAVVQSTNDKTTTGDVCDAADDIDLDASSARKPGRNIVFVGNLPFSATAASISAHFASLKPIAVRCLSNKGDDKPCKGIAFIEFATPQHQRTCLDKFHHSTFDDGISPARKINVELTAGGGGKNQNRRDKIREKNQKLEDNRTKRIEGEKKEKQENGGEKQARMEDSVHPSRLARLPNLGR